MSASPAAAYSALELLKPCTEADNDARWGEFAELECEQYIMGFVDALQLVNGEGICLPADNVPDEVRWAYMRWVHQDYSAHKDMAAGEALMQTLQQNFKCP
jgi:hypothetical protein